MTPYDNMTGFTVEQYIFVIMIGLSVFVLSWAILKLLEVKNDVD
jgi:hypothetical protein